MVLEVRTSRWVQFLFPAKMACEDAGVESSRKKWWIRGWRVYTGFNDIASIRIEEGLVFATLTIETKGGEHMMVDGIWKKKAKTFYDIIRSQMSLYTKNEKR